MLYLAGFILLAHNITPHRHLAVLFEEHTGDIHDALLEVHHQDHDDNDQHQEHNHKKDQSNATFVHASHPYGSSEVEFIAKNDVKQLKVFTPFMPPTYSMFRALRLPPKVIPPLADLVENYQNHLSASHCLRGPPYLA
jgi:hypothetical protein